MSSKCSCDRYSSYSFLSVLAFLSKMILFIYLFYICLFGCLFILIYLLLVGLYFSILTFQLVFGSVGLLGKTHRATVITWSNGMQTSWHQEASHTGRKDIWTPLSTCSMALQGCLILDCLVAGPAMATPQADDVLTGRHGRWRDQRVEVGGLRTGSFVELEKAVSDVCVGPSDSSPPPCSHQA